MHKNQNSLQVDDFAYSDRKSEKEKDESSRSKNQTTIRSFYDADDVNEINSGVARRVKKKKSNRDEEGTKRISISKVRLVGATDNLGSIDDFKKITQSGSKKG